MLLRLQVFGFKNLVDFEAHFGPFTCVAGSNGVGKSNLFDAILFLGALVDHGLADAADALRSVSHGSGDLLELFHRVGERRTDRLRFEADMLLPGSGLDELGESIEASSTLVRYAVEVALRSDASPCPEAGPLELISESLVPLKPADAARKHLLFPHAPKWRKSVVLRTRALRFISTEDGPEGRIIRLHQDGRAGRLMKRIAARQPRTLLSTVQSGEYPTAMLVRREMQSWRLLQFESSALRRPDRYTAPVHLTAEGAHLPSTLHHLERRSLRGAARAESDAAPPLPSALELLSRRLGEFVEDLRSVAVVRDEARQLLTLSFTARDGTVFPASSLSDGALRFLALAVIELDPDGGGLCCFECPENGVHPGRQEALLRLIQQMCTQPESASGTGRPPLRQVILNTHSPVIVSHCPDDAILVAESVGEPGSPRTATGNEPVPAMHSPSGSRLQLGCLPGTWRARIPGQPQTAPERLVPYLMQASSVPGTSPGTPVAPSRPRVADRQDFQMTLPLTPPGV